MLGVRQWRGAARAPPVSHGSPAVQWGPAGAPLAPVPTQ